MLHSSIFAGYGFRIELFELLEAFVLNQRYGAVGAGGMCVGTCNPGALVLFITLKAHTS